jgi:hypothetical protein
LKKCIVSFAVLAFSHVGLASSPNNKFAYITTLGDAPYPIVLCSVKHSDGSFYNCGDSGFSYAELTRPGQIVFHNGYAYVTTYVGPVLKCDIDNETGILSSCDVVANLADTNIIGIAFKETTTGQLFAYIGDGNPDGQLWQCPVDPVSGSFGTCVTNSQPFANGLLFETLKEFNGKTYLYLPDGNYGDPDQQVWKCPIDPVTGTIPNSCPDSGAGTLFNGPDAIAFTSCSGVQYAYIANYNNGIVNKCHAGPNGNLQSCTALSHSFDVPNQIALPVIAGKNYFYMADLGAGDVIKCDLGVDGSLSYCENVDTGLSAPFGLTFYP